jgi:hypothetical protein
MNKVKNIFIGVIMLGLLGCASTLPPPKPADSQRAVIGISVKTRSPITTFTEKPEMVYFIKMDNDEDLYTQGNFIRSNYAKHGQIYLLNVKPGRYAAVACYIKKRVTMITEYTTFFPKELVKLTEVTVAPGTTAFMGEYVIDMSLGLEDADDCQRHYCQIIAPGAFTDEARMIFAPLITGHGDYYYRGSLHEKHLDREAEIRFLNNAQEHFEGTFWTSVIQKRSEELEKGIQISTADIEKDIEQSPKVTDQPKEKKKLISTPEKASTIKVTGQPKEKTKVAAIPKEVPIQKVSLRKKSLEISEVAITDMLLEYDFFERSRNTKGAFVNDFVDNKDGTVTDKATGLMWQKSGSSSSLENRGAKRYIKQLNRKRYAGHSDWRMPTVEQLASLLAKSSRSGTHIDPIFDLKQTICWTVDKYNNEFSAWIVDFKRGQILQAGWSEGKSSFSGWYSKNYVNYVKAVRLVK